jgi:hypothetical protein
MKRILIGILIGSFIFISGSLFGYWIHPNPIWDISKDKRACVIKWDDGTYSFKSKIMQLGTLQPGESKTIEVSGQIYLESPTLTDPKPGPQYAENSYYPALTKIVPSPNDVGFWCLKDSPTGSHWMSSKEVIEEYAKKGKICEIYGHWWEYPLSFVSDLVNEPSIYRICRLCGKRQIKKPIEWEDTK